MARLLFIHDAHPDLALSHHRSDLHPDIMQGSGKAPAEALMMIAISSF
jgi:hypothetical protein